jgi:hypothetical protein
MGRSWLMAVVLAGVLTLLPIATSSPPLAALNDGQ